MKQQGLNAVDQLKGLALDKLKEALGLPTYLNDPPCSLTDSKYTPNTNGIKKGNSHRVLSQINCVFIWYDGLGHNGYEYDFYSILFFYQKCALRICPR